MTAFEKAFDAGLFALLGANSSVCLANLIAGNCAGVTYGVLGAAGTALVIFAKARL